MLKPSVYLEYKERQKEFKEVHKFVEKMRTTGFQQKGTKQQITQLEEERVTLNDKLDRVRKKLEKLVRIVFL